MNILNLIIKYMKIFYDNYLYLNISYYIKLSAFMRKKLLNWWIFIHQ